MATLRARFRKDGTLKGYYARWYDKNRLPRAREITLHTKDEETARAKLVDLERRAARGDYDPWRDNAPEEGVTVREAVKRYIRSRKRLESRGELALRTIRADESVLNLLVDFVAPGLTIELLTPRDIETFLTSGGLSKSSWNTYLARLSGFGDWCRRESLVRDNPCRDVRTKGRGTNKGPYPFLSRSEFDRLLTAISADTGKRGTKEGEIGWLKDVLVFMVETGLRPGEVCAMRWDWLTEVDSRWFINIICRPDFTPKWQTERVVPVSRRAGEILNRLQGSGHVFKSRRGQEGDREMLDSTYVSKRFLKYRRLAQIPSNITLHSLRHTNASWLVMAGVDLYKVNKLLGHRSIETTMRYAHLRPDNLIDAVDRISSPVYA